MASSRLLAAQMIGDQPFGDLHRDRKADADELLIVQTQEQWAKLG